MELDTRMMEAFEAAQAAGEMTQSGKPRTEFLEAHLGEINITAEERDALWEEYLARKAAGEAQEGAVTESPDKPVAEDHGEPAKEQPGPVMYLGPTIVDPVHLVYLTIFRRGEVPAPVKNFVDQNPALSKFFVPITDVPKTRAALKQPGSDLARSFATMAGQFSRRA